MKIINKKATSYFNTGERHVYNNRQILITFFIYKFVLVYCVDV